MKETHKGTTDDVIWWIIGTVWLSDCPLCSLILCPVLPLTCPLICPPAIYLSSEVSPSNRLASIHVVSSGYSTNQRSNSGWSRIFSCTDIQSLKVNKELVYVEFIEVLSTFIKVFLLERFFCICQMYLILKECSYISKSFYILTMILAISSPIPHNINNLNPIILNSL